MSKKSIRKLSIQRAKVQRIEDYLIKNIDQVDCPVTHHFTDNKGTGTNTCCREFRMKAGTLLTGVVYKAEVFWVMVQGKMRMAEGKKFRDVEAPALLKNVVGTKNALYAYEDCLFYGFLPNPDNSRDIEEIGSLFIETPMDETMGMPNNKQAINQARRLENATN